MILRLSLLLLVLMLALFLVACGTVDAPDPNLDGTSWHVLEINGEPLPEGIEITANFTDETIGGEAPCNIYTAEYSHDGNQISIDAPLMTQMYCDEDNVMETEKAFTTALVSVRQLELEGNNLLMQDGDGEIILLLGK